MSPAVAATVERIGRLADDEAELRAEARRVELDPARWAEARRLFAAAGRLRAQRTALLDRWLTR